MDPLGAANVEFCLDVFKELSTKNLDTNIFFSPLSMLYALSMVLLGARGNSAHQMVKVLHFNDVERISPGLEGMFKCGQRGDIHKEFQMLMSKINRANSDYALGIASRLYGTRKMVFLQQYLNCSEELYGAQLEAVDFEHPPEETRKRINAWVAAQTHGAIPSLFGQGAIDPTSVMVLVNAIYFKGKWESRFLKSQTVETPFHLSKGRSLSVQMMHQSGRFKMASVEEPQLQVIELPYVQKNLSMIVLLPNSPDDLEKIERRLTLKTISQWTSSDNMTERDVDIQFPRFHLEEQYELNSVLQALGMTDIFDQSRADLSGISPGGDLFLTKVTHKAFVEVNEEGTEAAAATGDIIAVKRLPVREKFVADHPFLFFIRHVDTNTILFCGRFSSP
ncbi:serpin B11 isoform X2 [Ornithorhynchus anatinus]|uniref:serpin B11 isoform X2 n=1 Tax=Ornithorhynchus anatinus TaxID=9258 RepID=UPI000155BB69|nr:serpin B11 isoform X2 [Ornithorhynchus anatinus]